VNVDQIGGSSSEETLAVAPFAAAPSETSGGASSTDDDDRSSDGEMGGGAEMKVKPKYKKPGYIQPYKTNKKAKKPRRTKSASPGWASSIMGRPRVQDKRRELSLKRKGSVSL